MQFPLALPITAHLPALARAIAAHQVTVVCGATGSGKSTQLPKLCLREGYAGRGRIAHTQPRRLAARSIAQRIATELCTPLGGLVGFHTRFERQTGRDTRLKLMTDGILLQEIHRDRLLRAYDLVIIDEVHERSVNIDLLLGYLHGILPRRPELRLVLTSATIEAERFTRFFEGAACLEIPGHSHPVEVRYQPPAAQDDSDLGAEVLAAVTELDRIDRGDILVFLPGEREINEVREVLRGARLRGTRILPLYARLGSREQRAVFEPHRERHIVLATNVAETSLTVPGVRHVIDSGLARLASYSPRSKLQRLPVVRISRASAAQRRGRCGRERPGICIRLFSEEDFARRPEHTPPEIKRSNLAAVILKLAALDLGRLDDFPLLDPPEPRAIQDGYALLTELGALDAGGALTATGRRLARLPLDPRLGRMVLAADELGSLGEVLVIVAALAAGDVREEPPGARAEATAAHLRHADRRSDFLWYRNAWVELGPEFRALGRRRQLAFCQERFWSWRRVREWQDIHRELQAAATELGLGELAEPASYRAIHGALLCGLLGRIGRLDERDRYVGTRGARFRLHPASTLRAKPPPWLVAAEIVETTAPYARIAGRVEAAWIAEAARPLLRRSHAEPAWDPVRGQAMVLEDVSLYGLTLSSSRPVPLAPLDRPAARAIFLRDGLVGQALGAEPPFLAHNGALVAEVRAIEARVRRRDLLVDEAAMAEFYAARLPAGIHSRRELLAWLRADPARDAILRMHTSDVTQAGVAAVSDHLFPPGMEIRGQRYALDYAFEPGAEHDGVTVTLPVAALPQLSAADFDRLVPGLLRERVLALLKSLPKDARRSVSPLAEFADALTTAVEAHPGPLVPALVAEAKRMTGATLPADAFRETGLPPHLQMRYRLVDERGRALAAGRDLAALAHGHRSAAEVAFTRARWPLAAGSGTGWTFGALPVTVTAEADGLVLTGYPALAPVADGVELRIEADAEAATRLHREGVVRLLLLTLSKEIKYLRKSLARDTALTLRAVALGWPLGPAEEIIEGAVRRTLAARELPRDARAFAALGASVAASLVAEAEDLRLALAALIDTATGLRARLAVARLPAPVAADLTAAIGRLVGPGIAVDVPPERLAQHPRYLRALTLRLDRALRAAGKAARKLATVPPLEARIAEAAPAMDRAGRVRLARLAEELRVAVFAPEVGTAEPVSVQRIERELDALGRAARAPPL